MNDEPPASVFQSTDIFFLSSDGNRFADSFLFGHVQNLGWIRIVALLVLGAQDG